MSAPSTERGDSEQTRYAWRVLSVTSLGVLLTALNSSTLDVALPAVVRGIHAGPGAAGWLLLSYLLATTGGVLVLGRLADVVGRRPSYLAGLVLFTAASLGSGLAPDVGVLLALRVLAGLGAAAVITNTTPLITDAFPDRLRTLGLGFNVTAVSASQVGGPVVGGVVADQLGWRAVFWVFAPLGLVATAWAAATLRHVAAPARTEPFDVKGAMLSVLALSATVLGVSLGGIRGWSDPAVLACLLAALVLWPTFARLQARTTAPLVDLQLFTDRARTLAYAAAFAMSAARFAVVLLLALYLQAARGESASAAGLHVVPVALGMLVAAPLAGRLNRTLSARALSSTGLLLATGGLLALAALLSPTSSYAPIGVALAAVGVGSGLFFPPNTDALVGLAPPDRRGAANAVRSAVQNTGYVLGTALALALVTGPLVPQEKRAAYAGTLHALPGDRLALFTGAYRTTLVVLAVLTAAGAVASLLRTAGQRTGAQPALAESGSTTSSPRKALL
jgi:EmrB/QacA subfamily drug resistance transporter